MYLSYKKITPIINQQLTNKKTETKKSLYQKRKKIAVLHLVQAGFSQTCTLCHCKLTVEPRRATSILTS